MKKMSLMVLMMAVTTAYAQRTLDDFTLPNAVDGKAISLSTFPTCSGVVIIFTSNSCPYDEYYKGRISKIIQTYQNNVPVLLVNSLLDGNETLEQMTKKVQQSGLRVPYLADKDQVLMQKLGASKTPQAFLLKNDNGKFSVVYSGSLDDNAQVEGDVHHPYLMDAIKAMLANQQPESAEVRPVGCTIRKK
jgi:hypothetical protein